MRLVVEIQLHNPRLRYADRRRHRAEYLRALPALIQLKVVHRKNVQHLEHTDIPCQRTFQRDFFRIDRGKDVHDSLRRPVTDMRVGESMRLRAVLRADQDSLLRIQNIHQRRASHRDLRAVVSEKYKRDAQILRLLYKPRHRMLLEAILIIEKYDNMILIGLLLLPCGQLLIQIFKDQVLALIIAYDRPRVCLRAVCSGQKAQPVYPVLMLLLHNKEQPDVCKILTCDKIHDHILEDFKPVLFRTRDSYGVHCLQVAYDRNILYIFICLTDLFRHQLQLVLDLQPLLLLILHRTPGFHSAAPEADAEEIFVLRNTVEQIRRKALQPFLLRLLGDIDLLQSSLFFQTALLDLRLFLLNIRVIFDDPVLASLFIVFLSFHHSHNCGYDGNHTRDQ